MSGAGETPSETAMGKADWRWEPDLGMHVPGCSQGDGRGHRCGNGPLDDDQIQEGDCGMHGLGGLAELHHDVLAAEQGHGDEDWFEGLDAHDGR